MSKIIAAVAGNIGTVLLIVAAFLVGSLMTEVRYLKGGAPTGAPIAQNQPAGQAAPEQVTQLSDDQWKELLKPGFAAELGNKNAKVTMVEFTDYQCPFCSKFFTDSFGQIKKNFIDNNKIRYILRDLPLSFHPNAHVAAEAARCGGDQGKYSQMHDTLFTKQEEWANLSDPKAKFAEYAGAAGASATSFSKCVTDGKYKQAVDDDLALATKSGASGTPTFVINGKLVVGAQPYSVFEQELNAALQ